MSHLAVMLLVCFGSEGRRMYKAKPASYLFAFCLNTHVSCCWWWWNRSREGRGVFKNYY